MALAFDPARPDGQPVLLLRYESLLTTGEEHQALHAGRCVPACKIRRMRYSHTHSPRPSADALPFTASSRRGLETSYPPFSNFRKCRNCAEMDASPYRVNARSSLSVSQVSQSAAASITSRITSLCERKRRASYSPCFAVAAARK